MRNTSVRRRAAATGSQYRGDPGQPVERRRHDYTGDGPAFICERCGARVWSERPRYAPGGARPKPWSLCGELEVANDIVAMRSVTAEQAAREYLVTAVQIARRWKVSKESVRLLLRDHHVEPVARLRDQTRGEQDFLYSALEVDALVRAEKPRWVLASQRPERTSR